MKISDARMKANRKYNEKAYDRIGITVKKGRKVELKAFSDKHGESLNGFINKAIEERIERLEKNNI